MLRTVALLIGFSTLAAADEPRTYPLWPKVATEKAGTDPGDANHAGDIPTITVYPAPKDKATGASIVICPGGGYEFLATEHEGKEVAEWLNSLGVTGMVLKYRHAPKYRHPASLDDARRAIRLVRWKSTEWGLDPDRVGVMGFSAGGHLASTLVTHYREDGIGANEVINKFSERPDVAILIYPVITLAAEYNAKDTGQNLLGQNATPAQLAELSTETKVTEKTPPTFLAHTLADVDVPIENSLAFAAALRKNKVIFELHVFEKGGHGLGLGKGSKQFKLAGEPTFEAWPSLCATWLKSRGFLDKQVDEATVIGRSIQAVDRLLEYRLPTNPAETDHAKLDELRKAVVEAGHNTHLYPWVRGRLQLATDTIGSVIRDTHPEPAEAKEMRDRVAFLGKLIIEIDAPR
jgi:acetyl esterase/lipase